ncbi:ALBINO3-like protein 2, chloroplastic isoform X3 [Pistacia vera]|uniref:ALBINO3-like protein 2, chloroplastic isoform X3 n=1 Tax=Pistacia vera TaxID=55513 RepID=UPI0012633E9A|nr:ALBINO3-like protein 2, chloroplastic isoform X3 [Pistacia vera]
MLPLFFIGYCIPQQLSLKHPAVHVKLGLPDKDAPSVLEKSEEIDSPGKHLDSPAKQRKISLKDLTHQGLVALSVKHLSKGSKERAISFLQLALDKDLDYISALIVMGQTQLQKGLLAEAIGYLERAISKGQTAEGIVHLEGIANLAEPEEKSSKVHYYDGLVLLSRSQG